MRSPTPSSWAASSRSSTMPINSVPPARIEAAYSRWRSVIGPANPSSSICAKPRIALSGVRNSWLAVARNTSPARRASGCCGRSTTMCPSSPESIASIVTMHSRPEASVNGNSASVPARMVATSASLLEPLAASSMICVGAGPKSRAKAALANNMRPSRASRTTGSATRSASASSATSTRIVLIYSLPASLPFCLLWTPTQDCACADSIIDEPTLTPIRRICPISSQKELKTAKSCLRIVTLR